MNEIVNNFLLAGDKFMPEMHLKQTAFTYSACGPITKSKEWIQKWRRTAFDKVSRDIPFYIAKNLKFDGYQRGLRACRFKANNGSVNFPSQFCLGSISNKYRYTEAEEVSLKGNVYDFSIDYGKIGVDDILDIHKYLMKKIISYKNLCICKANICFTSDVFWL